LESGLFLQSATISDPEKFNIDINDVANGVGLSGHAGRHSKRYSQIVEERLGAAQSADGAKQILDQIGRELKEIDQSGAKNVLKEFVRLFDE